ncbi:MAG: bifunctional demethylmenaquinone methyltransferase/2-methoxy-6-polyprenyl-1,4-benzoquinol methylase UbiE [Proteobacteria bacterium]|jgi:demethylmenaquinone methyltransferase / 2-methoxy-6-polyprenyl-1,4-benzoquinol methylase|nr:bifunctional demethylmenaquinone methyltransferase/2-methoxy-6-polyprenyl-1,4-benzoquinol methylase UbiE [Pseudomonadota bacterium]
MNENLTHFGFRDVPQDQKSKLVGKVFHSVASRYDIMNDVMSFGAHRLWKRFAISQSGVKEGNTVLDVAAGSGDLSAKFSERVGPSGWVLVTDINESMLLVGRDRLIDAGCANNLKFILADAQYLPFKSNFFDCVSISFGLRNVTDKLIALSAMYRCLKPGGRLLVLEFSKPVLPFLSKAYDEYSFNVIPSMGELITGDKASYQYLVESIRKHPAQDELKQLMLDAGFDHARYHNLSAGIVALHIGYKY